MHPTFRSALEIYDVGGRFRCIFADLYKYQYRKLLIQNLKSSKLNLRNWNRGEESPMDFHYFGQFKYEFDNFKLKQDPLHTLNSETRN